MVIDYLQVSVSILGFLANIISQVASFHYFLTLGLFRSIILGFAVGFITLVFFEIYLFFVSFQANGDFSPIVGVNLATYISLAYCYWAYINIGETSLRIRILRELHDSKEGLSMNELLAIYNPDDMFEKRLERLVKYKQIIRRGEKYFINKKILLIVAKIIVIMKLIIVGKKSEFD